MDPQKVTTNGTTLYLCRMVLLCAYMHIQHVLEGTLLVCIVQGAKIKIFPLMQIRTITKIGIFATPYILLILINTPYDMNLWLLAYSGPYTMKTPQICTSHIIGYQYWLFTHSF